MKRKNPRPVGSHVREAKPSAPPSVRDEWRPISSSEWSARIGDRKPLGALFSGESKRCACGAVGGQGRPLSWVTVVRREQDEEGQYREVTTAAWRCADCRQGALGLGFGEYPPSHLR